MSCFDTPIEKIIITILLIGFLICIIFMLNSPPGSPPSWLICLAIAELILLVLCFSSYLYKRYYYPELIVEPILDNRPNKLLPIHVVTN
jgi:energy-coupling factor transporter transmembrane protein EcfT